MPSEKPLVIVSMMMASNREDLPKRPRIGVLDLGKGKVSKLLKPWPQGSRGLERDWQRATMQASDGAESVASALQKVRGRTGPRDNPRREPYARSMSGYEMFGLTSTL